jgi:spermidine synthase
MNPVEQWIGEAFTPDDIWQHRVTKVLVHCQTEFQDLFIVESGVYGKALVLDDRWQTCTGDEFLYHEPLVHTPFVLHGNPRRVLIAGGADGGAAREALKWNSVEEILLVDIDGAAVGACREWLPEIHQGSLDDSRVRIEIGDAFDVIERSRGWDVIIADLTDPIESGPAYKLFTQEFFSSCRRALATGGLFVNQAGSMSPPLIEPLARTARTIGSVFQNTLVISAHVPTYGSPWGLAIASDEPLASRPDPGKIDELLQRRTSGPLRMFDGQSLLGLLQTPKYVRDRIEAETVLYTLANPPQIARQ